MANIYFFSGPCGCGKTTLSNAFAKQLANNNSVNQVYLIHGDDFHAGFVETDNKEAVFVNGQASNLLLWQDILKFNWDCILGSHSSELKSKTLALSKSKEHLPNIERLISLILVTFPSATPLL